MKSLDRSLLLAGLGCLLSIPAMALEPISEKDLSNQTGQAGAQIDLNLQLNQNPHQQPAHLHRRYRDCPLNQHLSASSPVSADY